MTTIPTRLPILTTLAGLIFAVGACGDAPREAGEFAGTDTVAEAQGGVNDCLLVEEGFGPAGTDNVQVEEVVSGLEVPWGIAFLPDGDMLVTERPGRIRLVEGENLVGEPVATVTTTASGEGGLLGIALHPDFDSNRAFYVYYTTDTGNQVERWVLEDDARSASSDRIIVADIPAARFHNGGRLRFGPDGNLYIGTGDARDSENSQNQGTLAGKVLRVTPEGDPPGDNPFPNSPVFATGVRNTEAFDWPDASTMWLADHGPSGEMGREGNDEINVVSAGDNLGWPRIYGCETAEGMVTPALTWETAVPPGGAAVYRGDALPWNGDFIVGTLGSRHLHRVVIEGGTVEQHEVYLQGDRPEGYGRLREVVMGPDGHLYVTTSNCDGRGTCPPEEDKILRITG